MFNKILIKSIYEINARCIEENYFWVFHFLKFLGPSSFISGVGLVAASFFHISWVLEEQLRGFLSGSVDTEVSFGSCQGWLLLRFPSECFLLRLQVSSGLYHFLAWENCRSSELQFFS